MSTDNSLLIHFETLGCKVNQIESESVAKAFTDSGYSCTMGGLISSSQVNENTILCVLNTCTVTAKAEQKARRLIRILLEKFPMACVIVTGCYAELEKTLLESIDKRLCVLKGTQKDLLANLPKEITNFLSSNTLSNDFPVNLSKFCSSYFDKTIETFKAIEKPRAFVLSTDTFMQHSRSSIKVQDGCNSRCTYCRICLARGKSVSLEPSEALQRILLLEDAQQHEVTITGINLSQYKCEGYNFAKLLQYLLDNTKKIHFRISSLHPQIVNDELCEVLSHSRVRPHFHLSIQSASDAILEKMARPYKAHQIYTAISKLREVKENPFIAADIIVGFPGETEEDFEHTRLLCEKGNLTWVHAFPFSPRPDTLAYDMHPRTPQNVANNRVKMLTEIAIKNKRKYIESCIGKNFLGIAERFRKTDINVVTENFLHVKCTSENSIILPENLGGKEVLVCVNGTDKKDLRQAEGEAFGTIISIF